MDITTNIDYKVKGYYNRWSVIDTYSGYALLENNTYGDETCYLVAEIANNVQEKEYSNKTTGEKMMIPTIMEIICETYDDIHTALEDIGLF